VVKTLEVREAADLGYDMVLGNTFHLFLTPGHELIARLGGLHRFMLWDRPVITDSGGFQVFSMGHGAVADEIKGRSPQASGGERAGAILRIEEEGVTFRSYLDGSSQFMGPETSMEVQAALGSDIALVFDECTPFHGGRDYTARSTERTHRWLDRCLAWHESNGPDGQVVYGIVQGGVEEDLRRASAQEVAARPVGGIAIGGTLGQDKDQMFEVVDWAMQELDEERPRHLLGIGEIDDLVRGVELGIDTFDCAMPTRIGRHGMAVVPDPAARWRVDLAKGRYRTSDEPLLDGCPCPACARGYTRAYLHYLLKAREQTAQRLLTMHNLAYLAMLMASLREAIERGRFADAAGAVQAGVAPWAL
jgi:queuine tRNA-ribosyltransferase